MTGQTIVARWRLDRAGYSACARLAQIAGGRAVAWDTGALIAEPLKALGKSLFRKPRAAPHPPFGHLLPVNGEKEDGRDRGAPCCRRRQRWRNRLTRSVLLPVHGEKMPAGR